MADKEEDEILPARTALFWSLTDERAYVEVMSYQQALNRDSERPQSLSIMSRVLETSKATNKNRFAGIRCC